MGTSCEGDALIFCRLLGFSVNSFDCPPKLGAVGPAVYAEPSGRGRRELLIRSGWRLDSINLHLCPSAKVLESMILLQLTTYIEMEFNQRKPPDRHITAPSGHRAMAILMRKVIQYLFQRCKVNVQQGFKLSPLLFSFYISDMPRLAEPVKRV